jgi:hypothetical protein
VSVTLTGTAVSASVGAMSATGAAQILLSNARGISAAGTMFVGEAAVVRVQPYLPPIQLPRNTATPYDLELQQAIKGWADRATQMINDLASRIP